MMSRRKENLAKAPQVIKKIMLLKLSVSSTEQVLKWKNKFFSIAVLLIFLADSAFAKPGNKGVFGVVFENDLFTGKDAGYTNGIRFSYTSSEEQMPAFIRNASNYLPLLNRDGKKRITAALGQSMYTPQDITKSDFTANDFFYAGWLYGSLGIISDAETMFDNVVLTLGMVGPSAQAEQSQKFVHKVVGSSEPHGWSHQLKDEFGVMLSYERHWRDFVFSKKGGFGFDVMPGVGVTVGNINTSASVAATFRYGYDLPADYGPPKISSTISGSDFFNPTKKLSGYLFTTFEARAVARNIFLDGNSFQNSSSLDKKLLVGSAQIGAAIIYKEVRLSFVNSISTRQFKGSSKTYDHFGGVTLSYRF